MLLCLADPSCFYSLGDVGNRLQNVEGLARATWLFTTCGGKSGAQIVSRSV